MNEFNTRIYQYGTRIYQYGTRIYQYGTRIYQYGTRIYQYGTRIYKYGTHICQYGQHGTWRNILARACNNSPEPHNSCQLPAARPARWGARNIKLGEIVTMYLFLVKG
jgi:hypothetical protein